MARFYKRNRSNIKLPYECIFTVKIINFAFEILKSWKMPKMVETRKIQ